MALIKFNQNNSALCTNFANSRPWENVANSAHDLAMYEQSKDLTGVPMPADVRKRLEALFNLPPVYTPDETTIKALPSGGLSHE